MLIHLQEPVRVSLGKRHNCKGNGAKRRCVSKEDCFMFVPVLKTLQVLLNDKVVLSEVVKLCS